MTGTLAYQRAAIRINQTPELEPYRDTLLYDWNDGDEHLDWVASAPVDELVSWAKLVEKDGS